MAVEFKHVAYEFRNVEQEVLSQFCDIYIPGVSREHWARFLRMIADSGRSYSLSRAGTELRIPADPLELLGFFDDPSCEYPGMMVHVGDLPLRCMFLDESEIELDFERERMNEELWPALLAFMRDAGEATGRHVLLTSESHAEESIVIYDVLRHELFLPRHGRRVDRQTSRELARVIVAAIEPIIAGNPSVLGSDGNPRDAVLREQIPPRAELLKAAERIEALRGGTDIARLHDALSVGELKTLFSAPNQLRRAAEPLPPAATPAGQISRERGRRLHFWNFVRVTFIEYARSAAK